MVDLSIVVPVFNEEKIIKSAIRQNINILFNSKLKYEIIIVNDGSIDQSKKIIDDNFSKNPFIRIIHKPKNEGLGSAMQIGFSIAKYTYIMCVPVDSPLDENMFTAFTKHIHHADVLVSYRVARLGYSFRMKLNSWLFHILVSFLFNMKLKDYNWIHLYHRKIFDEGKISIQSKGLFALAEVLIKANKRAFTFCEFPVSQQQRLTGTATASKLSSVVNTIKEIFQLKLSEYSR